MELDIFSGMPNPTWILTDTEADTFAKAVRALPRTSKRELSGSLGYRGMIVECSNDGDSQTIHIRSGTVQIASGATTAHAYDDHRELERWLLDTGRPHIGEDLFTISGREFR